MIKYNKKVSISPESVIEVRPCAKSDSNENEEQSESDAVEEARASEIRSLCNHWKMFVVIIIPISAIIMLSGISLTRASRIQQSTSLAIENIDDNLKMSELIQHLQRERGMSTSFIGTSNVSSAILNKLHIMRQETNTSLNNIKWPYFGIFVMNSYWTKEDLLTSLAEHRRYVENRSIKILYNLDYYTTITHALLKYIVQSVTPSDSAAVQQMVVASEALLSLTDDIGIQRAIGTTFFTSCGWQSTEIETYYMTLHGRSSAFLDTAIHHHRNIETQLTQKIQNSAYLSYFADQYYSFELFKDYKNICSKTSQYERETKSIKWFSNMTIFIDIFFEIRQAINTDIQSFSEAIQIVAQFEFNLFLSTLIAVVTISAILFTSYVYFVAKMTGNLLKLAEKVKRKTEKLAKEKNKTDSLLYQMLPKQIVRNLKKGTSSMAELFNEVTIYFSDIVGFTQLGAESNPIEIVNLLNDLYSLLDECIDKYDVYKVETIGDSYMVASGVPTPNGKNHAPEIALMALQIRQEVKGYTISHMPGRTLQIRIGLNSGPCVAGCVGTKMPRYCLFGDTVNTASRMQSFGIGGKIHISSVTQEILSHNGNFITEFRGLIDVKGKGQMATYWLEKFQVGKHV
ncbi:guanylate cyclase soluble subunit beta-2-like [Mytilus trossulus]|uniref:guanylate cyclase soluble subunit beta-2-like n=1 Tax=Mytilus trossulus TaxID=6551 RepID=UPI003003E407